MRRWEKSAREATVICNQAASFNRGLFKVQRDMQAQLKAIHSESNEKSFSEVSSATEELQYLMEFNASITQAAAKMMEHLKQLVNQLTHLQGHIPDLILSPSDRSIIVEVKICDFVSDHSLVKCSIILPHQAANIPNKVQYRRYHRINMSNFCPDLKNTSFVKSSANAVVHLHEQYVHDLVDVLDKHAPLISRLKKKDSADWVSDSYRCSKSLRRQFERTWCRTKNPLNRSRLHRQIAHCNSLVNKDKSDYYRKLISDNSQNPRKLLHVLRKTLSNVSEVTLPPHESDKALADQFASFFHNKIKILSSPLALKRMFILLLILQKLLPLLKFLKILLIKSSETCLRNPACWILGLHFFSKSVVTYYYHQLQCWLTARFQNCCWFQNCCS